MYMYEPTKEERNKKNGRLTSNSSQIRPTLSSLMNQLPSRKEGTSEHFDSIFMV